MSSDPAGANRVSCAVCGGRNLRVFWEAAGLPIHCHLLCRSREDARRAPKGDIRLAFCDDCGLVRNVAFDPELMKYAPEYENSLHFSPRFQSYARELASRLVDRHHLHNKDIVEIACGKGDFLTMLCALGGNRGVGFDPSAPAGSTDVSGGGRITLVPEFYDERHAARPTDLICCRHALEHIADPAAFLDMVRANLANRGEAIAFFEVPNVLFTLRHEGFWDVIYEHCSYFSPVSLAACFARAGFEVLDVREEYDGQFLTIEASPAPAGSSPASVPRRELDLLARDVEVYAQRYRAKLGEWQERLAGWKRAGRKVVIWGSGSKTVTFLNLLQAEDIIGQVVDINPRKHGMFVTGAGQEIIPPSRLEQERPDVVIVMNPIYADEIGTMVHESGVAAEVVVI